MQRKAQNTVAGRTAPKHRIISLPGGKWQVQMRVSDAKGRNHTGKGIDEKPHLDPWLPQGKAHTYQEALMLLSKHIPTESKP